MKKIQTFVALSLALLAGIGALYFLLHDASSGQTDDEPSEIVYVDTKSGATFLIASRSSPQENPETGERTLVPGMYCSECQAWKAVGPQDNRQIRRTTMKCPIHKIPLTSDVPDPD